MRELHLNDDMQPQTTEGLYVAAFYTAETNRKIAEFQKLHKIPDPVPGPSLHTTIVYSRLPVEGFEVNHTLEVPIDPAYSRIECWDTPSGRTLVWVLFSPYLEVRFQEAIAAGATYDYEEYKPHITLSYDIGSMDHTCIPDPNFAPVIAGEYSEPLDTEW